MTFIAKIAFYALDQLARQNVNDKIAQQKSNKVQIPKYVYEETCEEATQADFGIQLLTT